MMKNKHNLFFYNTLISKVMSKNLYDKYNIKSIVAPQKFFYLLAEGFKSNFNMTVEVNSLLPVNYRDARKIFWKPKVEDENGIKFKYIPLINLPIIRNIFVNLYVFLKILFGVFSKNDKNIIIVDFLKSTVNLAVILASKLRGIKVLAIVTDMPGYGIDEHKFVNKMKYEISKTFVYDFYVCLTIELNDKLNTERKPFLIIEGLCDNSLSFEDNVFEKKFKERVIVYAGALHERYGIIRLIEAFSLLPEKDLRLWIYGEGPLSKYLLENNFADSRIDYKGFIENPNLLKILSRATLLVNPRPTHEEYTKFSFPSKNMEYMSTGTPLLSTKLSGIPDDHIPYIYLIEEDTVDGIYRAITNVLSKSNLELYYFGASAKQFVLKTKNNIFQANKIITLLNDNI